MDRPKISEDQICDTFTDIGVWLTKRLDEKGRGSFSSTHEIRGVIDEEVNELKDAMHAKDFSAIEHELKDLIVGALFGLACLKSGNLQW